MKRYEAIEGFRLQSEQVEEDGDFVLDDLA